MIKDVYYKDVNTGEVLKFKLETDKTYIFKRINGEFIEKSKQNEFKKLTCYKSIQLFEDFLNESLNRNKVSYM